MSWDSKTEPRCAAARCTRSVQGLRERRDGSIAAIRSARRCCTAGLRLEGHRERGALSGRQGQGESESADRKLGSAHVGARNRDAGSGGGERSRQALALPHRDRAEA